MRVSVVGGGVIGYAVAYELASRGARVRVIDMRGTGQGATRASAGMLAPHIEGHHEPLRTLGTHSLSMYDAFVDRVRTASGLPLEYRRAGTLQVARRSEHRTELAELAAQLAASGVRHTWLDRDALRREQPTLAGDAIAGLLIQEHGYVRVPHLMRALEAAAAAHGVERSVERVEQLDPAALGADVVVMAAGSWSGLLTPAPVRPIKGQIVQLRTPVRTLARITWDEDCYLVPWEDGAVLVGATAEDAGFDETANAAAHDRLVDAARRLVPALGDAVVEDTRVGLRPATPDELPVIGRSSTMPAVVFATGHFRNGILLAPLTASLVADLVLDGREGQMLDLVRPARFNL